MFNKSALVKFLVGVIVIIVVVAIGFNFWKSAPVKKRDQQRVAEVQKLQVALEAYAKKFQSYPLTLSRLVIEGFLSGVPVAPEPKSTCNMAGFCYRGLGSGERCTSYHLGVMLENPDYKALKRDADAPAGQSCYGSLPDFNGNSLDCYGGQGQERCYDVTPE